MLENPRKYTQTIKIFTFRETGQIGIQMIRQ